MSLIIRHFRVAAADDARYSFDSTIDDVIVKWRIRASKPATQHIGNRLMAEPGDQVHFFFGNIHVAAVRKIQDGLFNDLSGRLESVFF